jgi:hypothetical protein
MRPRIHHLLSPAERALLWNWRRGVFAVFAMLAAAIGYSLLTPHTRTVTEGVRKHEQARAQTCVQRTGASSDAIDRQMPGQVAAQHTNGGLRDCR